MLVITGNKGQAEANVFADHRKVGKMKRQGEERRVFTGIFRRARR